MEKSRETKGKIHSAAADLLKLIETELSKVEPGMIAKLQKLPMEVQVRILLLAALEASGQQNQGQNQPVSDWGDVA